MTPTTMSTQQTELRILQLEFNEISLPVIEALIKRGKLPHFAKIIQEWTYLKTHSETDYELQEPWIQWVSVHTGKTFAEHQIFRLGDAHQLKAPQIWESLSQRGVESGIIGSMNATRGKTQGGVFFPDPWALKNEAFPSGLRSLWALISGMVQAHATTKLGLRDLWQGFTSVLGLNLPLRVYGKIARQFLRQKINPLSKWKLAGIFDLFLSKIFLQALKTRRFGFYTLFLNAVAHYQHHYWRAFDGSNFDPSIRYSDIQEQDDPMTYGYVLYDQILGKIMTQHDENTLILLLSGLSQVPFTAKEAEGGMNYYRLNDHQFFLEKLGLGHLQAFPLMSRDWQVRYQNEQERTLALDLLSGLKVSELPLFRINEDTPGFLFLETSFTQAAADDLPIQQVDGRSLGLFNDFFTNIAIKSGHHTGIGHLWVSKPSLCPWPNGSEIELVQVHDFALELLSNKKMGIPKSKASLFS
jgi:hypothetical protein